MRELQPNNSKPTPITPSPLNPIQVQALRNDIFGHPETRDQYTEALKAPGRFPATGTILQFRARPTGS